MAAVDIQRARVEPSRANQGPCGGAAGVGVEIRLWGFVVCPGKSCLGPKDSSRAPSRPTSTGGTAVEGGREHKGSYLRIKAARRQAQFESAQQERDVSVAGARLARVLGRDLYNVPVATGFMLEPKRLRPPPTSALWPTSPRMSGWRKPTLWGTQEAGLTLSRGDYYPSLGRHSLPNLAGHAVAAQKIGPGAGGISLSLPLFAGGAHVQGVPRLQAGILARVGRWPPTFLPRPLLDLKTDWTVFRDARENDEREFAEPARCRGPYYSKPYTNGLLSFRRLGGPKSRTT